MNSRRILSLAFSSVVCLYLMVALLVIVDNRSHAQGSMLYVAPGGDCGEVLLAMRLSNRR